jgi:hypothetical protein
MVINQNQTKSLPLKKKNIFVWIILMILPIVLLVFVAISQIIVQFNLNRVDISTSPYDNYVPICAQDNALSEDTLCGRPDPNQEAITVIRIIQVLLGFSAVVMIMLAPLWIILLVRALDYNKKLTKPVVRPVVPQQ